MTKLKKIELYFIGILLIAGCVQEKKVEAEPQKPLKQLQQDFKELGFGMFISFNMATYHEVEWAEGNEPAISFNPQKLDCNQWAMAAKSAGMKYAMLTTKHVDGFSLWDTKASDHDIASSPYKKDIVQQFVDAFRKQDIKIGLYFSIWDRHHDFATGKITPEKVNHIKTQITELLSNYGKIDFLWLDGYKNAKRKEADYPSTTEVPFEELYSLAKKLQPNILVMRHPGMKLYDTEFSDVQLWECIIDGSAEETVHWNRFQKEHPDRVQEICDTIQAKWFWKTGDDKNDLMPTKKVLDNIKFCVSHNCNYLLNAAPNRDGLMDQNVTDRLKEVGIAGRGHDRFLLTQSHVRSSGLKRF
jgi:alpha-L-fucosidase